MYSLERDEKMKSIIPYTKSISLGSKIAEITSMSLEHELEIKPGEISGNFIISGEYKSHEVSVNKEPFLQKLPFSIELTENIDLESVDFEITDFSYDLLNDDTIEVAIEFGFSAEEIVKEEGEEAVMVEEIVPEERNIFEVVDPVLEADLVDLMETEMKEEKKEEEKEEEKEDLRDEIVGETNVSIQEVKEDMKESEDTIISQVNPTDDSFATYHIHIVKEGETVETICTMYQSNMNLLTDYNDLKEVNVGDKIIVPKEDE